MPPRGSIVIGPIMVTDRDRTIEAMDMDRRLTVIMAGVTGTVGREIDDERGGRGFRRALVINALTRPLTHPSFVLAMLPA